MSLVRNWLLKGLIAMANPTAISLPSSGGSSWQIQLTVTVTIMSLPNLLSISRAKTQMMPFQAFPMRKGSRFSFTSKTFWARTSLIDSFHMYGYFLIDSTLSFSPWLTQRHRQYFTRFSRMSLDSYEFKSAIFDFFSFEKFHAQDLIWDVVPKHRLLQHPRLKVGTI